MVHKPSEIAPFSSIIFAEIVDEAVRVLNALDLEFETETALVGGAAYEAHGHPLPESTLKLAKAADAILFGAVGDWRYDKLERALRPEASSAACRLGVTTAAPRSRA